MSRRPKIVKTLIAQPDFSTAVPTGWPTPFVVNANHFGVSGSVGWCMTEPGDHDHLEDFRATLPDLLGAVESAGHFSINALPTLGEVTAGFGFSTGPQGYFTELVHKPGSSPKVQAGQVFTPFPLYGQKPVSKEVLSSEPASQYSDAANTFFGLRTRTDFLANNVVRWRTRIWIPSQEPEPLTWFQDVRGTFPDLAQPGQFWVQFSQGEAENAVSFQHGCQALEVYSVGY